MNGKIGQNLHRRAEKWLRDCIGCNYVTRMVATVTGKDPSLTPKQPFDILGIKEGSVWCLECKSADFTLPFSALEQYQLKNLLETQEAGANSYYIIQLRAHKKIWMVPPSLVKEILVTVRRGSFGFELLEIIGTQIEDI